MRRHGGRHLGPDVQVHGRRGAGGRRVEPDRRLPITEASGTVAHPRRLPPSSPAQHAADEVHPRLPEIDVDDAVQDEVDPTCRHRGGHNTVSQHSVVLGFPASFVGRHVEAPIGIPDFPIWSERGLWEASTTQYRGRG